MVKLVLITVLFSGIGDMYDKKKKQIFKMVGNNQIQNQREKGQEDPLLV